MKKKQTLLGDVLETVTKYFLIAVAAVVLFILLSGFRVVKSGNVALVLRFGKLVGANEEEQVHKPGLLFAFPYFVDEVIMVPTDTVIEQSVTTHYTQDGTRLQDARGGYLITGDQNVVLVAASVKYSVTDPVAYALQVKDISIMIDAAVSSAMLNEAASMDIDALLTDGKDEFSSSVKKRAQDKLKLMEAGVTISSIELTQVATPEEVRSSFQAVNAASVQAETVKQRARTYYDTIIPEAEAKANSLVAKANSEKAIAVANANVALAEFTGIAEELASRRAAIYADHGHAEGVTEGCAECDERYDAVRKSVETRVYTDKFTLAIGKIKKVYLTDGDSKIFINP